MQGVCIRDIAGDNGELQRASLGLAAAVVDNKSLKRCLSGDEIKKLIEGVCNCAQKDTQEIETRTKCMSLLAVQTFSGAQVRDLCTKHAHHLHAHHSTCSWKILLHSLVPPENLPILRDAR